MPISKYFKGSGAKVMKKMKKEYGAKKGKSVFYATAQKHSMKGSDTFSKAEMDKGYKVMFGASKLHEMDVDRMHYVKGYTLAKRRNATDGKNRTLLRRSEA